MAKPWAIVGGTGFDLEDIDNPRSREMECPSCKKWVRFVEKDLVKNLKVFGLSLIGVEDPKRVFACPSCNTAIEPPEDAGLARTDPKIAVLDRRAQKLKEDIELWERRATLAARSGDDVLARDAQGVVRDAQAELAKVEREMARLTAWDEESSEEKPVVVARLKSSGAIEPEGPSLDKAFSALKSKIATVASAVGGGDGASQDAAPKSSSPFAKSGEADEARRKEAAIERAAEDEFAALKSRLKTGVAKVAASDGAPVDPAPAPVSAAAGEISAEPSDQSRGFGEEFGSSSVSAFELGLGAEDAPPRRGGSDETPSVDPPKGGGAPATPPSAPTPPPADDDDPVAALKRKLKKPSP